MDRNLSINCLDDNVYLVDLNLLQPVLNLRDLGLSELKIGHIDQLVGGLLPGFCKGKSISSHWHTSHVSAQSFFENKYGK